MTRAARRQDTKSALDEDGEALDAHVRSKQVETILL